MICNILTVSVLPETLTFFLIPSSCFLYFSHQLFSSTKMLCWNILLFQFILSRSKQYEYEHFPISSCFPTLLP